MDSPLESSRFADAEVGKGFVVRAVDNSNIVPVKYVDRVAALAKENGIPAQYGVTGGGNGGSVALRYGAGECEYRNGHPNAKVQPLCSEIILHHLLRLAAQQENRC